jgi:AcrR family transcriptional regulator
MKSKDPEKIKAIHRATLKLATEKGLSGITMSGVAKASGMATGTLYIYFDSKAALLNHLYQTLKRERNMLSQPQFVEGPVKKRLQLLFNESIVYRFVHYEAAAFMEQFYYTADYDAASRAVSEQMMQGLRLLLDTGKQEGIIKPLDNTLLLTLMLGFMKEIVLRCKAQGTDPEAGELLKQSFDLCWDALKA